MRSLCWFATFLNISIFFPGFSICVISFRDHTITDFGTFKEELVRIRDRGYALDNEENEDGVRCIAVSLRGYTDRIKYAFSISAPVGRMGNERIRELAGYILEIKRQIEEKICPQ